MMPEHLHGGAERLPIRYPNGGQDLLQVSRYRVAPGATVSLHVHTGKVESWVIVSGAGRATIEQADFEVSEGDVLITQPGQAHALLNTSSRPLIFVNFVQKVEGVPITTTELESIG